MAASKAGQQALRCGIDNVQKVVPWNSTRVVPESLFRSLIGSLNNAARAENTTLDQCRLCDQSLTPADECSPSVDFPLPEAGSSLSANPCMPLFYWLSPLAWLSHSELPGGQAPAGPTLDRASEPHAVTNLIKASSYGSDFPHSSSVFASRLAAPISSFTPPRLSNSCTPFHSSTNLSNPPDSLSHVSTRRASFSSEATPPTSFPGSIEGFTTSWLTDILSASGAIGPDSAVQSFESKQIGKGVGLVSALYSIRVTYIGAPGKHAPSELVAKFAHPSEEARAFALR